MTDFIPYSMIFAANVAGLYSKYGLNPNKIPTQGEFAEAFKDYVDEHGKDDDFSAEELRSDILRLFRDIRERNLERARKIEKGDTEKALQLETSLKTLEALLKEKKELADSLADNPEKAIDVIRKELDKREKVVNYTKDHSIHTYVSEKLRPHIDLFKEMKKDQGGLASYKKNIAKLNDLKAEKDKITKSDNPDKKRIEEISEEISNITKSTSKYSKAVRDVEKILRREIVAIEKKIENLRADIKKAKTPIKRKDVIKPLSISPVVDYQHTMTLLETLPKPKPEKGERQKMWMEDSRFPSKIFKALLTKEAPKPKGITQKQIDRVQSDILDLKGKVFNVARAIALVMPNLSSFLDKEKHLLKTFDQSDFNNYKRHYDSWKSKYSPEDFKQLTQWDERAQDFVVPEDKLPSHLKNTRKSLEVLERTINTLKAKNMDIIKEWRTISKAMNDIKGMLNETRNLYSMIIRDAYYKQYAKGDVPVEMDRPKKARIIYADYKDFEKKFDSINDSITSFYEVLKDSDFKFARPETIKNIKEEDKARELIEEALKDGSIDKYLKKMTAFVGGLSNKMKNYFSEVDSFLTGLLTGESLQESESKKADSQRRPLLNVVAHNLRKIAYNLRISEFLKEEGILTAKETRPHQFEVIKKRKEEQTVQRKEKLKELKKKKDDLEEKVRPLREKVKTMEKSMAKILEKEEDEKEKDKLTPEEKQKLKKLEELREEFAGPNGLLNQAKSDIAKLEAEERREWTPEPIPKEKLKDDLKKDYEKSQKEIEDLERRNKEFLKKLDQALKEDAPDEDLLKSIRKDIGDTFTELQEKKKKEKEYAKSEYPVTIPLADVSKKNKKVWFDFFKKSFPINKWLVEWKNMSKTEGIDPKQFPQFINRLDGFLQEEMAKSFDKKRLENMQDRLQKQITDDDADLKKYSNKLDEIADWASDTYSKYDGAIQVAQGLKGPIKTELKDLAGKWESQRDQLEKAMDEEDFDRGVDLVEDMTKTAKDILKMTNHMVAQSGKAVNPFTGKEELIDKLKEKISHVFHIHDAIMTKSIQAIARLQDRRIDLERRFLKNERLLKTGPTGKMRKRIRDLFVTYIWRMMDDDWGRKIAAYQTYFNLDFGDYVRIHEEAEKMVGGRIMAKAYERLKKGVKDQIKDLKRKGLPIDAGLKAMLERLWNQGVLFEEKEDVEEIVEEHGVKKASLYDYPTALSYSIAQKFAGVRLEEASEFELISR